MALFECTKTLSDSPVAKSCIEAGIIKEVSNLTIASCVEDIKLVDNLKFAKTFLSSLVQQCEQELASNEQFWKSNASNGDSSLNNSTAPIDEDAVFLRPSLPSVIAASVCLGDCNDHGECVNSTCICNRNFTGPDCSVEIGKPPSLITFLNNGMCDWQKKPCQTAYVIGEGFVESSNLSCLIHNQKKNEKIITTAEFKNIYEVGCVLPERRVRRDGSNTYPVEHYYIRVTVDGIKYSRPLPFSVFDSKCFQCIKPGNCSLHENGCLISDTCYADNETSVTDWCQTCQPSVNQLQFSKRLDNDGPVWTSPSKVYVVKEEVFEMNLTSIDSQTQADKIQYNQVTDSGQESNVTAEGKWTWKVSSTVSNDISFAFVAFDECGDTSDPLIVNVEFLNCNCSYGKAFIKNRRLNGQGVCDCKCDPGYSGNLCDIKQNTSCTFDECFNDTAARGFAAGWIALYVTAPVAVIVVIIAVIIWYWKKQESKIKKDDSICEKNEHVEMTLSLAYQSTVKQSDPEYEEIPAKEHVYDNPNANEYVTSKSSGNS